jgi:hypothetical protein
VRAGASPPIRAAPAMNMPCGCSSCSLSRGSSAGHHADHRRHPWSRALRPQSHRAVAEIFRGHPADRGTGRCALAASRSMSTSRARSAPTARSTSIAAHAKYGGDLIIIDFGTATTFEAIDFTGAYKGGIIAPGHQPVPGGAGRQDRQAAAHRDRGASNTSVIGRNTEDQMLIGVFWGYVAMMEGLVAKMKAEIGRPAKVSPPADSPCCSTKQTDVFDVSSRPDDRDWTGSSPYPLAPALCRRLLVPTPGA